MATAPLQSGSDHWKPWPPPRCASLSAGWNRATFPTSSGFRGISEYKIDWGPGLRIYPAKDGLKIIILIGGGTKKRQQQDIDQAVVLWEDYKRRKASTQKGK